MSGEISNKHTLASRELMIVTFVTLLCLILFISKAFHLDDTLFLWTAKQIQAHPLDFYGFNVNWYFSSMPMYEINQNPPLISYFIALVTLIFGWSEWVLHTAFLIPAILLSIGIYKLSLNFCTSPLLATLISILTPIYMVSSTNIMAEVTMVAFYVWAIYFWLSALIKHNAHYLFFSAILISLSVMTKYFAISLIPLLLAYSLIVKDKPKLWYVYLLIPLAVLILYQWVTLLLYDTNLFSNALFYSMDVVKDKSSIIKKTLTGLSFLGGGYISILFFSFYLWGKRIFLYGILMFTLLVWGLVSLQVFNNPLFPIEKYQQFYLVLQFSLFCIAGFQIFMLAALNYFHYRDEKSLFLLMWFSGTLFFTIFINWSVNARTLLPMIPIIGILVVRRLEHIKQDVNFVKIKYLLPLIPAAAISLLVTWSDVSWANNQKDVATKFNHELQHYNQKVWFQGHWGFQYYMESTIAFSLNNKAQLQTGDLIITPSNNTNILPLTDSIFHLVDKVKLSICCQFRTMSRRYRAGFYADQLGELPFSINTKEYDEFDIHIVGYFNSRASAIDKYLLLKKHSAN